MCRSLFASCKKVAELEHVLLLDPVGAGASKLRTNTAVALMKELPFTVIRGNISEIKTLALGSGTTKGVDADVADAVREENLDAWSAGISAESLSGKIDGKKVATGATVIGTGAAMCFPMDDITGFLYLIGSVFAPMIAVQIAEKLLPKKEK